MPVNWYGLNKASNVQVVPTGNLTSTDLQSALLESQQKSFMGGYKNKIINGNFDIWQRGTSQNSDGVLSADRWNFQYVSGTVSKYAMPVGHSTGLKQMARWNKTSTSASASHVSQKIESVWTFQGKKATVQFIGACGSGTKNGTVYFIQRFGTGGSPSTSLFGTAQPFTLTSSYQQFTLTFDIPSILGKTLGTDGNDSLDFRIEFDTATHEVYLGGIQVEEGSIATPFESRHIAQELALCQRYYEVASASISGAAVTGMVTTLPYKVRKRAVGTVTRIGTFNTGNEAGTTVVLNTVDASILYNPTTNALAVGGIYTLDAEL